MGEKYIICSEKKETLMFMFLLWGYSCGLFINNVSSIMSEDFVQSENKIFLNDDIAPNIINTIISCQLCVTIVTLL